MSSLEILSSISLTSPSEPSFICSSSLEALFSKASISFLSIRSLTYVLHSLLDIVSKLDNSNKELISEA